MVGFESSSNSVIFLVENPAVGYYLCSYSNTTHTLRYSVFVAAVGGSLWLGVPFTLAALSYLALSVAYSLTETASAVSTSATVSGTPVLQVPTGASPA